MKAEGVSKRLGRLEKTRSHKDALLSFSDGSTRALRVRDVLGLTLASFDRVNARNRGTNFPESKFDSILDLLAKSEALESEHNLLHIARDCARKALEPLTEEERRVNLDAEQFEFG